MSSPTELLQLAANAREHAYAPFSKYHVGCALLTPDGTVFTGCNVENSSYGLTNCAERTAVFKAVSEGHQEFAAVAIVAGGAAPYPCGACRQVLNEFCAPDTPVYIAKAETLDEIEETTLGALLPKSFRL
jgi:cytidine deaminase